MITFEVCCGSYSDAAAAERGGASRVELNSALSLGGLTPDIGGVYRCKEELKIRVIAMLRPRVGGFCYTKEEYKTMRKTAECLLSAGADGLAFGFLTEKREIDVERTGEITELAHSLGKEAVFHRAFDCTNSFGAAADQLIASGVDRILTSGGERTALLGWECLRKLEESVGSRIQILAGSGVRSANVAELLEKTGVRQVHSSCRGYVEDRTARGNGVAFDCEGAPQWYCCEAVAEMEVQKMSRSLARYGM